MDSTTARLTVYSASSPSGPPPILDRIGHFLLLDVRADLGRADERDLLRVSGEVGRVARRRMPSQPAHPFPAHFCSGNARHLAQGTWPPRAVRSSRIELTGTFKAPGQARRAVELHLSGLIGDGQLSDIRLLVSELVSNAIRYGEGSSGVVLHLAASASCVRVEVCDGGSGFDVPHAPRPEGTLGGHGLGMLDMAADRWGVAGDDGTCVWFELGLTPLP
jgi:anti-sigma regulatory factor (Ser/Thr protein kinase)